MIVVIIAGGSGTRLWPLSTGSRPKHLLKVVDDKHSLLQATYERAKLLADHVYIVSEASHAAEVREQLPNLPDNAFIIEPARRGTANCIIAALSVLSKNHDATEPIAFMAADHYIRNVQGFTHSFLVAAHVARENKAITLIGVDPNYPAEGFGYIEKGKLIDDQSYSFKVASFREKPTFKVAQRYLASGKYLWNCGYFIGSLSIFLNAMEQCAPELKERYEELIKAKNTAGFESAYLSFESESIDVALIEKVQNLLVVPALFDWMDLGSFNDLHKALESDETGNHTLGQVHLQEVSNSFIQNHEDKPVAVIGLDNVVVVNTRHGVLITRKDLSQKVGEIAKKIQQ